MKNLIEASGREAANWRRRARLARRILLGTLIGGCIVAIVVSGPARAYEGMNWWAMALFVIVGAWYGVIHFFNEMGAVHEGMVIAYSHVDGWRK